MVVLMLILSIICIISSVKHSTNNYYKFKYNKKEEPSIFRNRYTYF